MKVTYEQDKALRELLSTARAVVSATNIFPEDVKEEISEAADVVEEMILDYEVDHTDWNFIDSLGQALLDFGEETKDVA